LGLKGTRLQGSGENYTMSSLGVCTLTQYCSGDQIEKNEMDGARSMYGERRGLYRNLVGKPQGKRPLGRPRRRWEDNIKMNLQEVGRGNVGWMDQSGSR